MLEVIIIGNVSSIRLAAAGQTQVLNLSIASSRKVGGNEHTDWLSAKIWGERATKLEPHISKGAKLMLRGRPEARGYKRNDGTVAAELVLHVFDVEFLSPKPKEPTEQLTLEQGESKPKRKKAA